MPKSMLGAALAYAVRKESWLMNVFLDGRLELSNNRAERAVRPFALGRKNWLFSNTSKGADASAAVYSIVETAKANGLKPFDYLRFLLERLPNGCPADGCLPCGNPLRRRYADKRRLLLCNRRSLLSTPLFYAYLHLLFDP